MLKKVDDFIRKNDLLRKGSVVVVGVSGGPDSVALLHYISSIQAKLDLTIVVAHVDHMFRGKESEQDFAFVRELCKKYNVFFEGAQINVPAYQLRHNLSPQIAARECRYDFFKKVMDKHKATHLALGHHGDDQIETVLMRLVRGSYVTGLSGIPVRRSFGQAVIIRPFLILSKSEIELYCTEEKIIPRHDKSNESRKYTRNRIRHDLLPLVKSENPKAHERFQFISEILYEDNTYLNELAEKEMKNVIVERNKSSLSFSIQEMEGVPIPLQRRGIHLILKYLYGDHMTVLSSIHYDILMRFIKDNHPSGKLQFPMGLHIEKSYGRCFLTFNDSNKEIETSYHEVLQIPGEAVGNGEMKFILSANWIPFDMIEENHNILVIDPSKITLPLIVRTRKPGDRIQLANGVGHKKLKDLFIDEKIPINHRNSWPVVTDSVDRVLWIPQLKKAPCSPKRKGDGNLILLTYSPD